MADDEYVARWIEYFYPETFDFETRKGTMRNLAGLRDAALLKDFEYSMTAMRQTQLDLEIVEIPKTYDSAHLQAIHQHLFQDVYEWAGEFRTVDIAKAGKAFAQLGTGDLDRYLEHVVDRVAETPWARLDEEGFVSAISDVYSHLNQAHPFREGNGRTSKVFLEHITQQSQFVLNFNQASRFDWNIGSQSSRPMDDGIAPRPEKLKDVMSMITTARAVERHPPRVERPTIKNLFGSSTSHSPLLPPPTDPETGPRL
ncbi:Fic/DOC family protein [Brachybacterium tyrofermentans]|uniref:Fic/DOC family protein n=1 Tax=Brachybacterium tyrofermentans TaxID=47848 RepID=UPI003FD57989